MPSHIETLFSKENANTNIKNEGEINVKPLF